MWSRWLKRARALGGGGARRRGRYAYLLAAAHVQVKHVTVKHLSVSSARQSDEGWAPVDALRSMRCSQPAIADGPALMHACQGYSVTHNRSLSTGGADDIVGDRGGGHVDIFEDVWMFHKAHVPPRILECGHPLLQTPPDDLFDRQRSKRGRRRAFALCVLHAVVNDAARSHKRQFCPDAAVVNDTELLNTRECVRLNHHDAMQGRVGRLSPYATLVC